MTGQRASGWRQTETSVWPQILQHFKHILNWWVRQSPFGGEIHLENSYKQKHVYLLTVQLWDDLLQFEKVNFSLICCVAATTWNPREEFRLEYAKSKNIWPNFIWFQNIWVNKSTELFGAILKTSIKNRLNEEAIVTFYTLSTLYFSVFLWEL